MQAVSNYLSEVNYKRMALNAIGVSALVTAAVAALALAILLAPTIFPASFVGAILFTGLSVTSVSLIGAGTLISGIVAIALANIKFATSKELSKSSSAFTSSATKTSKASSSINDPVSPLVYLFGSKEAYDKLPIINANLVDSDLDKILIESNDMKAPIMRGTLRNGDHFIARKPLFSFHQYANVTYISSKVPAASAIWYDDEFGDVIYMGKAKMPAYGKLKGALTFLQNQTKV